MKKQSTNWEEILPISDIVLIPRKIYIYVYICKYTHFHSLIKRRQNNPGFLMDKRCEQTLHKKRYTDG